MKKKSHRKLCLRFDRTLSHDSFRQIFILMGILLVAFLLSFVLLSCFGGDWQDYCEAKHISKWIFPLYLLIDANAFNNFYSDEHISSGAVFMACLIYVAGVIIFTGMIISVMTNIIERRVEDHREGRIHYLKSGHYIIMGYDEMVPSFISHVFDKDKEAYILIFTAKEATGIKELLLKSFSDKQMKRVIINYGHRISTEAFKDIYLESAEEVFVVGNHSNTAHDAINVECVDSICRYLKGLNQRPARITCMFKDLDTYAAFKTSEIFSEVMDLGMEFVPYNFYSGWAKQVFVKRLYRDFDNPGTEYRYPLVYGKGIKPSDEKYVHLVFVGTTNFAVAFAMEAAHVLHFPNGPKVKTRITFIDVNADKEKDEFITRNRHFFEVQAYSHRDLSSEPKEVPENIGKEYLKFTGENANFLDVEFEFIKGDVFSRSIQDEIKGWAEEHKMDKQYLSIFLALADQRQNFVMGMNMPDEIYVNKVPVFIRQNRSDNFVTNLRNADTKKEGNKLTYFVMNENGGVESKECDARYAHIYPFGMNETAFSADDHSLKRAKLINYLYETANYETYKFQDVLVLDAIPENKIWEESNTYWQKLSVALKWSNLYNSYTMRTKQRILRVMRGLDIDDESHDYDTLSDYEVEQLAIVEHNRWNVEKLLMGYRKPMKEEDKYEYPAVASKLKKNKDLFIHHDIRPFGQLKTIKELDYEFSRYIPWIMKMAEK